MNLATALSESSRRDPNKTALFWGEAKYSYGTLWSQTLGVADRLRAELGVQPGDRVGIWLKNCPEFIPALFGILQCGAVVVPINNFLKPDEGSFILADAGINVLIVDEAMRDGLAKLQAVRPSLKALWVEGFDALVSAGERSPCNRVESDLAIIIYTSGTTGHPKGAMLSHGNLLANVKSCEHVLEAVGEDRFVVLLPMFHSFMLTVGILLPLLIGGSLVLIKTLHPPKNIVAEIIAHRATLLPAVPQFFRALTHGTRTNEFAGARLHQWRSALAGGDFEGVYRAISHPAPGGLWPQRSQPCRFVHTDPRAVEGGLDRCADS